MRLGSNALLASCIAVPFLLLVGCQSSELTASIEFDRLSRAIDELREAQNHHKSSQLEALRQLPCQDHCALKELCVQGYDLHVVAVRRIERTKGRDAHKGRDALEDSADDAANLERAKQELADALRLTTACAARQAESRPR